jgi:hypothetical protein
MKWFIVIILAFGMTFLAADSSRAAVGCDLNDPDRDVARLFPDSTGYKTLYVSINQKGGKPLQEKIEQKLGDRFQGLFETADVPYTIYTILHKGDKIGYIHGVNQKGQFGGIQVFLVLDLQGNIKNLYFQKLTSKAAKLLRDPQFGKQFTGLSLSDFQSYDVASGKTFSPGKIDHIRNPAPQADQDFKATLRAVKKNLILMDEFIFSATRTESFPGKENFRQKEAFK